MPERNSSERAPDDSPFDHEDPSKGAFPDDLASPPDDYATPKEEAAGEAREPSRYNPTLVTAFIGLLCLTCVGYALFNLSDDDRRAAQLEGTVPQRASADQQSERPEGVSEADAQRLDPDAFPNSNQGADTSGRPAAWKPPQASNRQDVSRALSEGASSRNPFTDPPHQGPRVQGPGSSGSSRAAQMQKQREKLLQEALAAPTSLSFDAPASRAAPSAQKAPARPYGSPEAPDRTVRGRALESGGSRVEGRALQERYQQAAGGSPFEQGAAAAPGASGAAQRAGVNNQRRARQQNQRFLQRIRQEGGGPANLSEVHGPLPPFTLSRGTIVPIALESAVNSQLGGQIVARVTADVKDPTKEHVLIPAGAKIVSDYGAPSAVGQSRLLVAATRMNLPDGRYVNFRSARATDPLGRAGMEDEVDRHFLSRFGAVGALAVLGAAVNASAGPANYGTRLPRAPRDSSGGGDVVIYPPGAGYGGYGFEGAVRQSFAQEINRVLGKILERQIDRQPTIKLRPGLKGQLLLGEDLNMKRPYYEGGSDYARLRQRQAAALRQQREQRRRPTRAPARTASQRRR